MASKIMDMSSDIVLIAGEEANAYQGQDDDESGHKEPEQKKGGAIHQRSPGCALGTGNHPAG
jgi:hypothetical protein